MVLNWTTLYREVFVVLCLHERVRILETHLNRIKLVFLWSWCLAQLHTDSSFDPVMVVWQQRILMLRTTVSFHLHIKEITNTALSPHTT